MLNSKNTPAMSKELKDSLLSQSLQSGVISPMPKPQLGRPGTVLGGAPHPPPNLAWRDPPGTQALACIALGIIKALISFTATTRCQTQGGRFSSKAMANTFILIFFYRCSVVKRLPHSCGFTSKFP